MSSQLENESAEVPRSLDDPGTAKRIARQISADIEQFCVTEFDDGPRKHLGASLIGHPCSRHLWYVFRWCKHIVHTGRQYRLFNRGHREEPALTRLLVGIGFQVETHDANGDQFRVSAVGGHFGGSLDAKLTPPARYGILRRLLGEYKTNGTGQGFNALGAQGMELAKPQHFAQVSTYGYLENLSHVVYLNTNKNDDDLFIDVVPLNHRLGANMVAKAELIIRSPLPPERISNSKTYRECSYCDHKGICHEGVPVDKNCRSCKFAEPQPGPTWYCHVHKGTIPEKVIATGCSYHESINVT